MEWRTHTCQYISTAWRLISLTCCTSFPLAISLPRLPRMNQSLPTCCPIKRTSHCTPLRVIDLFHLRRTSLITFSRIRRVIQKHLVSSRLLAPLWEPRSKRTLPLSASPTSPTALPSLESPCTPPLRAVCVSSHLPLLRSRWSPSDYIVCAQRRPPVRSHLLTHKSENIATSIQAHCFTHLPVFDVNINNFAAWKSPGQHTVCASVVHGLGEPRRAQQKMKMFYSSGTLISSKLSLCEWISIMRFRYTVEFWVNYLLN